MSKIFSADAIRLAGSIVLCMLAGFIGSLLTMPKIPGWYANLEKPSFNPPGWLFGPVWTALYILMGIALFLVWRKGLASRGVRIALLVFLIQLVLNALWSVAFFGAQSPLAGLVVIIALWAAIVATIALFAPLSRVAVLLLVPYILWVSFAAILNATIYVLNR
jgi:benzodiazapine receptor